jgi:cytochrome c oxidase subunit 1/cytochrome c oxidase subunit I+III
MAGRMLAEGLGRWSFWVTFIGFQVAFFPMHIAGLEGMRRRVYTYGADEGIAGLNLVSTLGAFLLAAGLLLTLVNIIISLQRGPRAGRNPWNADTLEWLTESPPPAYAFSRLPTVRSRHPLWDDHDEMADPDNERVLDTGRVVVATSTAAARPLGIVRMPGDSIAPLLLALALAGIFGALVAGALFPALIAAIAAVAVTAAWLWPEEKEQPA